MNAAFSSHSNHQCPALYLYSLNDTWVPKHLTLVNERRKIGRQTSSKTVPGERNGFFDSKVLSRNHAEVWEEGGRIYIKDVKSSNGTFVNGQQLSAESQESEPFELKSDDILEFGIDIVGDDNKSVVHHKVAARVVCIFSEQDAQVAARAEQHQLQQKVQQQQYIQQQQAGGDGPEAASSSLRLGSTVSSGTIGPLTRAPESAGSQSFPFAGQRRAQLAQQSLGGLGGIRTPGKTGLSFDVVLSRLQGELQKSRETTAELNSLTGTMGDIHETLGGNIPSNYPLFSSTLPPVQPPQEAGIPPSNTQSSDSSSPEHPVAPASSNISASGPQGHRNPPHDTQSLLASHDNKIKVLEDWIAEQENMKREVDVLKEMIEERRKEMKEDRVHVEEMIRKEVDEVKRGRRFDRDEDGHTWREVGVETRGRFDMVDEADLTDLVDDDDAKSISTILAHELEHEDDGEDEEQLARAEEQVDEMESVPLSEFVTAETRNAHEAEERRHEDLNVGQPRTPDSSQRYMISPLSHSSTSEPRISSSTIMRDEVYEQVAKLSKQVIHLTSTLETQHTIAQTTIKGLQGKVEALEEMWSQEREHLAKAREEFDAKLKAVDVGLEKVASLQSSLVGEHQRMEERIGKHEQESLKPGRYRRRKRKSPGMKARGRSGSSERAASESGDIEDASDDADTDATLASSTDDDIEAKERTLVITTSVGPDAPPTNDIIPLGMHLATPASPIVFLESELRIESSVIMIPSMQSSTSTSGSEQDQQAHPEDQLVDDKQIHMSAIKSGGSTATPMINTHAAIGVVLLSVAAAAIFWKVKE
ncbi:hypothetical protein CPB83DRAFT_851363 [Crepidotus variabilis]|uniref:FHA domain-containing protein n=1 Tax=Crepidotus variabilis TaxID=179855 RepID=A0A9P6EK20_9AGAR|nr:hypothetical protein CPB83DRAFT_851363 [Crepidotus variabilis]